MVKYIISVCFFWGISAFAAEINIDDRMATRNFVLKNYYKIYGEDTSFKTASNGKRIPYVYHRKVLKVTTRVDDFSKFVSKRQSAKKMMNALDKFIPPKLLMPLVYWKSLGRTENVRATLTYIMLYRLLILRDFIDNPIEGDSKQKYKALMYLKNLSGNSKVMTMDLFRKVIGSLQSKARRLAGLPHQSFISAVRSERLISEDMNAEHPYLPSYSLSFLGLIPGNQVEIVSKNDRSEERVKWFDRHNIWDQWGAKNLNAKKIDLTEKEYSKDWETVMRMPTQDEVKEWRDKDVDHATYNGEHGNVVFLKDPIYQRVRDMVDRAQESIFIDIFLFGGTLGATLAKHILDKAQNNKDLKVLLLHDYATNYTMWSEMGPVFRYIRDRIKNENINNFMLVQANIQRHGPGVPFGLTSAIPKAIGKGTIHESMQTEATYYESKIDHSKVLVIDGKTDRAEAYFGSKNWSDHSGGYYYDDAIWIKGPGAALVQYSYYEDVEAALDPKQQALMYYKDSYSLEHGFGNGKHVKNRRNILNWFKIKRQTYKAQGDQSIRIAESNVDGRIKNVRNMLIDMISKAEKYIYMEQLFIYDPYINNALMKRKLQVPNLDIRILADHNRNFGFNGMPNTIYMREMDKYGIKLRAIKTSDVPTEYIMVNGKSRMFHQENHRKLTLIDDKVAIGGSSNANPDTFQGSFREFGAQIFDTEIIKTYKARFLAAWKNKNFTYPKTGVVVYTRTEPLHIVEDPKSFEIHLGEKALSNDLSDLLHAFASMLFRNKDYLEGRP